MTTIRNLVSCLALVISCLRASSQPVAFQSTDRQTALLELFTSEGCSSCPSAETWLGRLKESPGLWKEFVPVAFHVDYCDYLGWRDPWGSKDLSERQRAHAASWNRDSIYTPGFVLNGKEWRDWSRLKDGPKPAASQPGVLTVSSADRIHWRVSFAPTNRSDHRYEAHAALLASGLTSDIKAGENRGRRLNHDFVVLALAESSLTTEADKATGELSLAAAKKGQASQLAIAVWVTSQGHLEPLQAAGGWLPKP